MRDFRLRARMTTAPTDEPVTVEELRQHARISSTTEDAWTMMAIAAARQMAEETTGRALMTQTWTAYLDRWPFGEPAWLPRPPLIAVASVKYIDSTGVQQTLDPSTYQVDNKSAPGRFSLAYAKSWPSVRPQMNAIEIAYTCGYGAEPEAVPEPIRHAIMMTVAHWNEHRETVNDFALHDVPMSAEWALQPYRVHWFG